MNFEIALCVIVPLFKERGTLPKLPQQVRSVPTRKKSVIVDDESTDSSAELIRQIVDATAGLRASAATKKGGGEIALRGGGPRRSADAGSRREIPAA